MNSFSKAGKLCAFSLMVIGLAGLAACGSDKTGDDEDSKRIPAADAVNAPTHVPSHVPARHHGNISIRASVVPEVSVPPTLAPFLGNLSAIPASPGNGVILQRQTDCSLLYSNFAFSIKTTGVSVTIDSQTPHYEKIMRDNAFLTTPAGTYPNGCADQTAGTTSRIAVYLGTGKSGQLIAAALAVAATSVCWVVGGGSEVPPACAKAGVSGKRQSAKVISNRIKVAALIKSISVEYPRSISIPAWLLDYEIIRRSAAETLNAR